MPTLHPSLEAKVESIIGAVGDALEVHVREIMGIRRTARISAARQLAMVVIRASTNLSLVEIGDLFNRDHGTVIHAIKAVKARAETDPGFAEIYGTLQRFERQ